MASVRYTAIVNEIKGKIAGTIFQSGKTGSIMRATSAQNTGGGGVPTNRIRPYYPKQFIGIVSGLWRNLTDEQRTSFITGAISYPALNRFGDAYTPSGFQVFMTLNLQMFNAGAPFLTTCPVPISVVPLPEFSISPTSANDIPCNISEIIPDGFKMGLWATCPMAAGALPRLSAYKLLRYIVPEDTAAFNIATEYNGTFGDLTNYSKVYFKIQMISTVTGQKGVPFYQLAEIAY